jgi:hypothetical protein
LAVTTSFLRAEPEEKDKAGIVVVFKDITEFKALDRARRRVLDHLSHELKTPLSIILSSLKRLESSQNERPIERIRRNLIRLQDIQIFGGFYHSLETDLYSTKKPFDFAAGGKGLDLLRIKIFGETCNFRVECKSTRCQYIPRENDSCPGVIAKCLHVHNKEQCAQSGGTAFKLLFPEP